MMKRKAISFAVAGVLSGFAATAGAALSVQEDGVGHILLVPYFSSQAGNSTLLNIVNSHSVGKVLKVRFRSALDSDDIFDFQLFLSPYDMWSGEVKLGANGVSVMSSSDKSCTRPANINQDFVTGRLSGTEDFIKRQTREGYIEILNMADIVDDWTSGKGIDGRNGTTDTASAQARSLYYQTKHVNGVAPCTATVLAKVGSDSYLYNDLTAPSGGLAANWTIINVPTAAAYSGAATAIRSSADTRVVYWDQNAINVPGVDDVAPAGALGQKGAGQTTAIGYTADGVLLSDVGATGDRYETANYDFPDLSTPYEASDASAALQADRLSFALMTSGLANEYLSLSAIGETTDWVISMPTRRYHVAGRGRTQDGVSSSTTGFYDPTDKSGPQGPFASTSKSLVTYAADGRSSCVKVKPYAYYDREEQYPGTPPVTDVISPGTPAKTQDTLLCGEVTVVGMNQSGLNASGTMGANVVYTSVPDMKWQEGWAYLSFSNAPWYGLPAIGQAFTKATHPDVGQGKSGGFGANWKHRIDQAGVMSAPLSNVITGYQ